MAQRVTLKEVAVHAGVSYQTVSKVLNHQMQVSKETEARIWDSVRVLGYRPNQIARSLRSLRSHMIGYSWEPALPDQTNAILDRFLHSMAQSAEKAGYQLLAFPHRPRNEWVDAYRELIDTNRVDGFVLSSVEFDDPRILFLQERNFPFVAFGRSNPDWDFPFVDIDGASGMYQAVQHLVAQGHRRIAVLAWPVSSRVGQNRFEGVLEALNEAQIPLPDHYLARIDGAYQFSWQATARWLELSPKQQPTAVVAFSDTMAIGAMRAAQETGLQVGEDIAITGFDDSPMAQYLFPPLTSVRQPIWEVGQEVVKILMNLLDGVPVGEQHLLLAPQLVIRESSCCVAYKQPG